MSKRCKAWRPRPKNQASTSPPGTFKDWTLCRRKVTETHSRRCIDCETMLALHPDSTVRLGVAADPLTRTTTLELLASDQDPNVSRRAELSLGVVGAP